MKKVQHKIRTAIWWYATELIDGGISQVVLILNLRHKCLTVQPLLVIQVLIVVVDTRTTLPVDGRGHMQSERRKRSICVSVPNACMVVRTDIDITDRRLTCKVRNA